MMTRTIRIWLLAVCALAVCGGAARADVGPRWSDDQLAGFSSAIVAGRVTSIGTGRDLRTGAVHTYVTVAVETVFKGDIAEREIVVKQLGGRIGDQVSLVFGQAEFAAGESVLLFLEVRPRDRTLYTTALWQGKWTLERDQTTGLSIATRRNPETSERGILRDGPERRTLSTLTSRLAALGASSRVSGARRFVAEPAADEMRSVVQESQVALPFTQLGPYRWNEFDSGAAIPVDVQASGQPGLSGGGGSQLVAAMAVWMNATGLRTAAGGNTSRCLFAGPIDSHISIIYNDPCGDIDDSGGTIAVGGAQYTLSGGKTINGTAFGRAVAGYYVTNNSSSVQPYVTNSGCFQFVATHELGHVLGMGHTTDPSAIMFPSVSLSTCSGGSPGPSADDLAGIRFIYPPVSTPTSAPGTPTGLITSSSGSTVFLSWAAPSSGGTATAYTIEAGSSPGLANLANFSTGNTATSFSAGGVGAGAYYVRVRATNSSGRSAASNESLLTVGGACTAAPPPPGAFTLTGNSNHTVSFSWGASASATTYIIEAGSAPGAANLANANLGSSATSATFPGVGSGTYFVRLRAQNTCGTSGVSNEVTLVVP